MSRRACLAIIAACVALLIAVPAFAHETRGGARYLASCCNQFDCHHVEDRYVEELGGGHVRMTFKPGSHPLWGPERTHDLVMDYGPEHRREPIDGDWHGCFDPVQKALCYHPPRRSM